MNEAWHVSKVFARQACGRLNALQNSPELDMEDDKTHRHIQQSASNVHRMLRETSEVRSEVTCTAGTAARLAEANAICATRTLDSGDEATISLEL
jgi:hypothetical protein